MSTTTIAKVIERATNPIEKIRNIGIIAHIDAGKTTTTERILYFTGRTHKIGEVHDGEAVMDDDKDEKARGITINSAATFAHWRGAQLNIIDTPGHVDFTAEVERSLRVLDGGVGVFCAVAGVEPQSETVWRQADKYGVPRIAFVNKMDRQGADFAAAVRSMRSRLGTNAVAIQLPVGSGDSFVGAIDIIERRFAHYERVETTNRAGTRFTVRAVPQDLVHEVERARVALIESLADVDDGIAERYLSGEAVSSDDIKAAIRKATIERKLTPVVCGASLRDKGIQPLLDAIVDYLPSPLDLGGGKVGGYEPDIDMIGNRRVSDDAPFSALVFKSIVDEQGILTFIRIYSGSITTGDTILNARTGQKERVGRLYQMHASDRTPIESAGAGSICALVGAKGLVTGDTVCDPAEPITFSAMSFAKPVISLAISPKSRTDRDKLATALSKIAIQDPTFQRRTDPETEETIISGMGELHLEIILNRLRRDHGVEVIASAPQVAYKQTIEGMVDVEGRHVRQNGGVGQFGIVNVKFEHNTDDQFTFVDAVAGGSVPRQYIPSVEKGIAKALEEGGLLGVPFVNIKATLHFGKAHSNDSSDFSFQLAGVEAVRAMQAQAKVVLLEPRMKFEVQCPDEFTGSVIGHLTSKRAEIESIDQVGDLKSVKGIVPLSEMFRYTTDLRSMTSGRGSFTMQPHDYAPVPQGISEKIFAEASKRAK